MNALQLHELEELDQLDLQSEETKERFKIEDAEQLNWAMRKLSTLNSKKNGIDELAAKEMERITSWREKECDSINHTKSFFEGLIMEYAMNERSKDKEFKTSKVPYGKVTFTKQQPKWNYDDEKLISYLESVSALDLIRVKKEAVKTEIKKRFKTLEDGRVLDEEGTIVDGITVEYQEDKLSIKVGE